MNRDKLVNLIFFRPLLKNRLLTPDKFEHSKIEKLAYIQGSSSSSKSLLYVTFRHKRSFK